MCFVKHAHIMNFESSCSIIFPPTANNHYKINGYNFCDSEIDTKVLYEEVRSFLCYKQTRLAQVPSELKP